MSRLDGRIKRTLPLLVICILAIVLRFYRLGGVPLCLSNDEVAFGYNAFSILTTEKDEYGKRWPLIFESVGDAKLPLTIYILTIPVRFFGMTEWSVRLPSAAFGVVAVILIYGVVTELWGRRKVALVAALFLAISPWHLTHSRALFDTNLSFTLVLFGVFMFLRWLRRESWRILVSVLLFVGAIYTYYSDRLFVPLFVGGIILIYRKVLRQSAREVGWATLLGVLALLPLGISLILSQNSYRKVFITTIFGYSRPESEVMKLGLEDGPILYNLFHNAIVEDGFMIARRYFNHFSPSFLFISGTKDDLKQMIYGMGEMYLVDVIFLVAGVIVLAQTRNPESKKFIGLWLMLGPIPAAITRDEVQGRRAMEMLIPLLIISALGAVNLVEYIKERDGVRGLIMGLVVAFIFIYGAGYYLLSYYVFTPELTFKGPGGWSCGYKELVERVDELYPAFNKVIVDTVYQSSYLFFLFYQRYPPARYQPQARLVFEEGHNLGESPGYDKYLFRPIDWLADSRMKDVLLALPPEKVKIDEVRNGLSLVGVVYFPDGSPAFYLIASGR